MKRYREKTLQIMKDGGKIEKEGRKEGGREWR
jgi:hypothetical protein